MTIRKHLGKFMVMATVVMAVAMASTAAFAAKGVIKLHEGDWTGNLVFGKLAQIILSEEMDYKVKMIFLPAGPVVAQAIIGGEIDAGFESWPSYSTTKDVYITEWGGDGQIEKFGDTGVVGQSGWSNRPRFTGERLVQILGCFFMCVQGFIEHLLCFVRRDISDGAVKTLGVVPIDPFQRFPFKLAH